MRRFFTVFTISALIIGVGGLAYAYSDATQRDSLEKNADGLIDCMACHNGSMVPQVSDPHSGSRGDDCNSCHMNMDGWVMRDADEEQPADETLPADDVVPADDALPADDVVPADEELPFDDGQPADNGQPAVPGCGQERQGGTLQVACSNFPEGTVAARVMVFPGKLFVPTNNAESERKMKLAPAEGTARCKIDGVPVAIMSKDSRKTPAALSGGRHRVVVMVKSGLIKSELGLTNVVVNGDTTLNLDYEKLNIVGENLDDLFQKFKENAEKRAEGETEDTPVMD